MKPFLKIRTGPHFLRDVRKMTKEERKRIGVAIDKAVAAWGKPHLHAGSGIRHMGGPFYECRDGLKTRLLFEWDGEVIYFHMIGNHDQILRFLKTTRT